MNNSELFLLGLINQSPRYGYEIAQFLEESNAGLWINISMPYVYKLLKSFEERGLVSTQVVASKNRPNRTMYQITRTGHEALLDNLKAGQFIQDKVYFSSDVALAISAITNIDFNLPQLITDHIIRVKEELDQFDLQVMEDKEVAADVKLAHLIIEHRLVFLKAELEWLTKVQETIGEVSLEHSPNRI
jgi:DNA-binding PadR family transcriptional regulator